MGCENITSNNKAEEKRTLENKKSAQNQNNINISLDLPSIAKNNHSESSNQILVNPQPFKITAETSTDWPTVIATILIGVGSILTTIFVAWTAKISQRSQVRAAVANFRHGWQEKLRSTIARFIAITARIHYELQNNPDYLNSSESNREYSDLIENQISIKLMLDPVKDYSKEINITIEKIIKSLKSRDSIELNILVEKLTDTSSNLFEKAWQDIKNDLGAKK